MERIKEKRKNGTITLSHKLSKTEHVNWIELDIMQKGEIPMLSPVQIVSGAGGKKLVFQLKEYRCFDEWLADGVSFDAFCETVGDLTKVLLRCDAHGIRSSNLELEPHCIFVDEKTNQLNLIYWPLTTLSEPTDFHNAFLRFGELYRAAGEDGVFRERYLALFDRRDKFKLTQFSAQLTALREEWLETNRAKRSGRGQATRLFLLNEKQRCEIPLPKYPFVFGRLPDATDYAYPSDLLMSRSHFTLFEADGEVYIMDNGSTNGTKLNGKDVPAGDPKGALTPAKGLPLHDGDVIRAGSESLACRFH